MVETPPSKTMGNAPSLSFIFWNMAWCSSQWLKHVSGVLGGKARSSAGPGTCRRAVIEGGRRNILTKTWIPPSDRLVLRLGYKKRDGGAVDAARVCREFMGSEECSELT